MKIVACIKYSLDVSEIKIDKISHELRLSGVPRAVGKIDQNVLETAVALKEVSGGTVHGLSYGPPNSKEAFRDAMAMGLDDVTLIEGPEKESNNPSVTSFVLSAAIKKIGDVDLVICGEVSDDGFTYQVPPRLAEALDYPLISFARNITLNGSQVEADRELDDGVQKIAAALPVILSVTEETNTPRRPTLIEAMKAKNNPLRVWDIEKDLNITLQQLDQKKHIQRMDSRGTVVRRKQQKLSGQSQNALANELVDLLIVDQVLIGDVK